MSKPVGIVIILILIGVFGSVLEHLPTLFVVLIGIPIVFIILTIIAKIAHD
jgi:hypothetical protein